MSQGEDLPDGRRRQALPGLPGAQTDGQLKKSFPQHPEARGILGIVCGQAPGLGCELAKSRLEFIADPPGGLPVARLEALAVGIGLGIGQNRRCQKGPGPVQKSQGLAHEMVPGQVHEKGEGAPDAQKVAVFRFGPEQIDIPVFQAGGPGIAVQAADTAQDHRKGRDDADPGRKTGHQGRFIPDPVDIILEVADRRRRNFDHHVGIEDGVKTLAAAARPLPDGAQGHSPGSPFTVVLDAEPADFPHPAGGIFHRLDAPRRPGRGADLPPVEVEEKPFHVGQTGQPWRLGHRAGSHL